MGGSGRWSRNGLSLGCQETEHGANYRRGAGPQGTSGCSLPNEVQAMEWVDAQEKELQRLRALLVEHQVLLKSSLERPHQETMQAPPKNLNQCRCESFDYLPSTVNINRGAASKTVQVPDLSGPCTIKRDTL